MAVVLSRNYFRLSKFKSNENNGEPCVTSKFAGRRFPTADSVEEFGFYCDIRVVLDLKWAMKFLVVVMIMI